MNITELFENALFKITNKNNGNVTDIAAGTSGFAVSVLQQGTVSLPEISQCFFSTAVGSLAGKYFLISSTTTDNYVWFTVDGVGADPAVGGRTGIKVALPSGIGQNMAAGIVTLVLYGCEQSSIICNDASTLTAGDNFLIYNSTITFVPWYRIDEAGTEPVTAGTKVPIDILSTDLAAAVSSKSDAVLSLIKFQTPDIRGYFIRSWDHGAGRDPDVATRKPALDFINLDDAVGTTQQDEVGPPSGLTSSGAVPATMWVQEGPGDLGGVSETGSVIALGNETRPINVYLMPIIKY